MSKKGAIRDRINNGGNPERIRQAAYNVITRNQHDPAYTVRGAAIALALMCEELNMDMGQVISSSKMMIADIDGPFAIQLKALREYTRGELDYT
tara:strand:- start:30488 stop:30769 length:282 start_codon:yes stop_codon:yes gene_type:complete